MTTGGKYGGRKIREGTVVSDKMQKTVLVAVEANIRHPLYKKRVRHLRRFMAHDEREDCRMGDRVRIIESSPISRRKRWRVVEVLERAELPEVAAESIDLELLGEVKREVEAPAVEASGAEPGATLREAPAEVVSAPGIEAVVPEEVPIEEAEPSAPVEEITPVESSAGIEATEQSESGLREQELGEAAAVAESSAAVQATEPAGPENTGDEPVASTPEDVQPTDVEGEEAERGKSE